MFQSCPTNQENSSKKGIIYLRYLFKTWNSGKLMKFLANFAEIYWIFLEEFKITNMMTIFNHSCESNKPTCETFSFWMKMKKFFKILKKLFRFVIKSLWKLTFEIFLAKYFRDFCLSSEFIYYWKIAPVSCIHFCYFWGGWVGGTFSPPHSK